MLDQRNIFLLIGLLCLHNKIQAAALYIKRDPFLSYDRPDPRIIATAYFHDPAHQVTFFHIQGKIRCIKEKPLQLGKAEGLGG